MSTSASDRLIGYSVERGVYGPPLPSGDDVPTGSPIHQFEDGWVTRSKAKAAEVAQRLAAKNGGRFFLVRYTERGSKPVDSWTQSPRSPVGLIASGDEDGRYSLMGREVL